MNKKEIRQIYRFASAGEKYVGPANRLTKAIRRATESMAQLPALVAACKKKHGLTDR